MDEPINPLLIGGGVAGVVILLVAAVVGFRAYKRKQEAEFEAMMSEDLEEVAETEEEAPEEVEEPEPVDYSSMTVAQLKEILQERDLTLEETRQNWSLDSRRMTSNWRSSRQDWGMSNRWLTTMTKTSWETSK